MKRILIGLLFISILLLTGCNSSEEQIYIDCEGKESTIEVREGDSFDCELLGTKYTFKIEEISDDIITLMANKPGLNKYNENGTINIIKEVKEFKLEKGNKMKIMTQTEDYSEQMILLWD